MINYKKAKTIMEIFCIVLFILAIILGKQSEFIDERTTLWIPIFGTDVSINMYMELFIIPWIIFPLIIIFILAYYDNILSGILLVSYEAFVIIGYIHNSVNLSLHDILSVEFILLVIIPIIIGIIYIYSYIKDKSKIKNSR